MQGALVRKILYPQPIQFKFYQDSLKFVAALAILSGIGGLISIPTMKDEPIHFMLDRLLNLVTITVPPALATVMSQGMAFAVISLKKKNIFCISPPKVNLCGRIKTMVFDKTGTLTKCDLNLVGGYVTSETKPMFNEFITDFKRN